MKKLLLALTLTLASSATWGQCSGLFGPGQVCGNPTGSSGVATAAGVSPIIDNAFGSTRGSILERGVSSWGALGPGTTGLPFVSNGPGLDPSYTALTNAGLAAGAAAANVGALGGVLSGTLPNPSFAAGVVTSVVNSDGTLTITPTTGNVIASLALGHANTWTANQTFPQILFTGAAGNGINDQSAVAGNSATFWPGSVPTQRVNRLMVGIEASSNLGCSPPQSWLTTIVGGSCATGQIQVVATLGVGAINAGSRTSDERAALGTPSGGSAGGYFFGVSDDTGTGAPIGLGSNSVGIAFAGTQGITLGAQQDINSNVATCVPTPSTTNCSAGQAVTIGTLITAGAFASLATQDVTEGLVIRGGATARYNAGIMIDSSAVRSAVGPTILGSASTIGIAMPDTNYIIWYNGTTANAAIWGGGAGALNFFGSNLVVNGTAGVTCAGTPTALFAATNGLVTHC